MLVGGHSSNHQELFVEREGQEGVGQRPEVKLEIEENFYPLYIYENILTFRREATE